MQRLKLKHLDAISQDHIDYKFLAKELLNYNRWKFWQIFSFVRKMDQLNKHISEVRSLDFLKVEESEHCTIARPEVLDEIRLIAMLELQGLFDREVSEIGIGELIIQTIAIACFNAQSSSDFDIGSDEFQAFRVKVGESDLIYSMGLYQWINTSFTQIATDWNKAFFDVEVPNPEYDQAGGAMLNKFNVISTIVTTCQDFNVSYNEAQQMPYGITQANSLRHATKGFVENKMTEIAEARMKTQRGHS